MYVYQYTLYGLPFLLIISPLYAEKSLDVTSEKRNMQEMKLQTVLKNLMAAKNISSLRDLAKKTGVPHSTIASYLRGGGSGKPEHILALAKFFSCSMEYLLFGKDDRPTTFTDVATEEIFDGWLQVTVRKAILNKRKAG